MKILLLISLLFSSISFAKEDISKDFINLFIGKRTKNLKTYGCKLQRQKWLMGLLSKESFKEKITFNKACDLEGEFTVHFKHPFIVSLKVKDQKEYDNFETKAFIKLEYTTDAILTLKLDDSKLSYKKVPKHFFFGQYSMVLDPLNPKKPIKKKLGGIIKIVDKNKKVLKTLKL